MSPVYVELPLLATPPPPVNSIKLVNFLKSIVEKSSGNERVPGPKATAPALVNNLPVITQSAPTAIAALLENSVPCI